MVEFFSKLDVFEKTVRGLHNNRLQLILQYGVGTPFSHNEKRTHHNGKSVIYFIIRYNLEFDFRKMVDYLIFVLKHSDGIHQRPPVMVITFPHGGFRSIYYFRIIV